MTINVGDRVRWTYHVPERGIVATRRTLELTGVVREIDKWKGELRAIIICEPDNARRMVYARQLTKIK